MAQSQNIYWRCFLTEALISLSQKENFVNTKNRRTLSPAFRGNKFKEIPFYEDIIEYSTKSSTCQTKKTEELSSVFSRSIKQKNIGESLLRDIINNSTTSNSCQQKRSRNLDQFCVLLFLFSSDFSLDS